MSPQNDEKKPGEANRFEAEWDRTEEIDWSRYWRVVWKHRKLILAGTAGCMLLGGMMCLLPARVYRAQTTFFSTRGQGGRFVQAGNGVSVVQDYQEVRGELLIQITKSSEVAQRVVKDLDLAKLWGVKRQSDCLAILAQNMKIESVGRNQSEVYRLSVTDKDPQLAFRITESYLRSLQETNTAMNVNAVRTFLRFLDDKIAQTKADRNKAEEELRDFKIKHGILEMRRQSDAIVQGIATLQVELTKAETELRVLEKQFTRIDPEVVRLQSKIDIYRQRIRQLQGYDVGADSGSGTKTREQELSGPTLLEIPALADKMSELEQKVQIQTDIYKLLITQYESSRIEATREARLIQVLDKPTIPEDPEPQGTAAAVTGAGVLGLILTVLIAFLLEKIRNPGEFSTTSHGTRQNTIL
jgi:uncharacterized protein involved in exopolysaccharide biosynthesis